MDPQMNAILAGIQQSLASLTSLQTKALTGGNLAQLTFGPGGLFSNFGLDSTVVNASVAPQGIDAMLPVMSTDNLNPIYAFLTGFDPDGAAEPAGPCDDAPSGVMEVAHTTVPFGRYTRGSKEMEYNELVGVLNNRLTQDLRILGNVMGDGFTWKPGATDSQEGMLQRVIRMQMVIVGIEFQRLIARQVWTGTPVNNNVGGGYREFPGLDLLIRTGYVDAFTGTAAPALDSDVKDFNFNPINGLNPSILEYICMMAYYLENNARGMGLDPTEWVIAMPPQMFFELTSVWPSMYLTDRNRVTMAGSDAIIINDRNNVDMRDEMRQGNFLWVNGRRYPVAVDDGIRVLDSITSAELQAGEFASTIYFLPVRAKSIPVTYWEHLDYNKLQGDLSVLNNTHDFWASDGGRFLWGTQCLNWCFKIQAKVEPRIVLRTPQLAGKITNVKYSPLQMLRNPFPESPYFQKGGVESFESQQIPGQLYTPWSN